MIAAVRYSRKGRHSGEGGDILKGGVGISLVIRLWRYAKGESL